MAVAYFMIIYLPELKSQKQYSLTMSEWTKLHNRNKLSDYIPYDVYDSKKKIYHHKYGNFAIVYKINPRQFAGGATATCMQEILNKMEDGMIFQACLVGSKNDHGTIENWKEIHLRRWREDKTLSENSKNLIKSAVDNIAEFYYSKFDNSIAKNITTKSKDFSLYLSVSSQNYDDIESFGEVFHNILEGNRFTPKNVEPKEMQLIAFELLNSNHSLKPEVCPMYDENQSISPQCIAHDTEVLFTDDYIVADDRYWINMSPLRYPDYAKVNDMGIKVGDYISQSLDTNQFQDNFIISFTAEKKSEKKLSSVKRNHGVVLTQKWPESVFRKFNDVKSESVSILDRIDVKKEKCFSVDLNVLVSGKNLKIAEQNAAIVISYWNKGGNTSSIVLTKTRGIQQLCFLASMPSCTNSEYFSTTNKFYSMFGDAASQFIPIESDWKGTPDPNIMLYSRRGQLAGFDMFHSNNNYNGYVIAESGSGKSVFLNMIAFNSYLRGDKVFILDYGGSFKKLCEILGGQYIEPDRQNPFSLNPFSELKNSAHLLEELEFLSGFVYTLGANKNREEYEKNEKYMKNMLQDTINKCFARIGNKMEITDIRDELSIEAKKDIRINDFCKQIGMYCRDGIYEKFFLGKCAVDFKNEFIVAEIQQVEKDEDLRDPLIMLLTYHQSNAIYGSANDGKTQRIINIYDEAHKYIGKDPRMDEFIEQNYRRGRKQGASSIIATQGFEDIYDSSSGKLSRAGKAIINSSSWKFFLKQSETSINLLLKSGVLNFDKLEEEFMRTTKTIRGDYSEVFLITPDEAKYTYRLVLDKYFYYITTSAQEDKARIAAKLSKNMLIGEAIESVIKDDLLNK
ncbi:hypothetical protein A9K75_06645 [Campylobacter fetus subsp. testudinum]|nr:hypothetical protein A9K75_06645 [Campylobacter fetus subsp. testudinum]